jgi:hypothetical protein
MEANQFVLICAVFIVIAGFMVSIPDIAHQPEAKPLPVLICRFDSLCAGNPCIKRAPAELHVFPPREDGWTLISLTNRPKEAFRVARKISERLVTYYTLPKAGAGATEMTVSDTGAMRFEQTDGSGALIAAGEGYCRRPDGSDTATKNGDKV